MSLLKRLLSVGALALALNGNCAQESLPSQIGNQFQSGRLRTEYQNQEDNIDQFKVTLGIGPKGNYESLPISVKGQLNESAKISFVDNLLTGEQFTSPGANINLKLGDVSTRTLAFGSFGDRESFGLEEQVKLGSFTPSISFEHNSVSDAQRLGGQLTLNPSKSLTLAAGYDSISQNNKETTQVFAKTLVNVTANDTLAGAYANRDTAVKNEHIAAGFWTHAGKGTSYGSRLYGDFKIDNRGNYTANGHYIAVLSKNATIGPAGATLLLDRQASANQNAFGMSVADSPFDLEGIPIMDRTPSGLAIKVHGKAQHTQVSDSSLIAGTIAYSLPITDKVKLRTEFEYAHQNNSLTGSENICSPRFRLEAGHFQAGPIINFSDKSPTKFFVEATYNF